MAKPALPWLQRLCALYEKHEPSVYVCSAQAHSSGVLISLELDRGSVYLLAQPKERSGAYATTASMDVAIHNPPGAGPMPGNGELVVRQFIALLQRADKGDIHIKSQGMNSVATAGDIVHATEEEAQEYRKQMAGDLHKAAFLALKIHQVDGTPLRAEDSTDEERGHTFLYDALGTGFSRQAFKAEFGVEPNELAPQAFDALLALSAITIDGDHVRPTMDGAHELAVMRTFFLSPKQRDAADALWLSEYDADADYSRLVLASVTSEG